MQVVFQLYFENEIWRYLYIRYDGRDARSEAAYIPANYEAWAHARSTGMRRPKDLGDHACTAHQSEIRLRQWGGLVDCDSAKVLLLRNQ